MNQSKSGIASFTERFKRGRRTSLATVSGPNDSSAGAGSSSGASTAGSASGEDGASTSSGASTTSGADGAGSLLDHAACVVAKEKSLR